MKKAGLIIGVIFIVLALVLTVFIKKGTKPIENKQEEQVEVKETRKERKAREKMEKEMSNKTEEEQPKGEETTEVEGKPKEEEKPKVVEKKETTKVIPVSKGDLEVYKQEEQEQIITIESKQIYVIDTNTEGRDGKAVIYTLKGRDMSGLVITMPVNEVVYESKNVGEKLKVNYKVIENNNGIKIPAIESIREVE